MVRSLAAKPGRHRPLSPEVGGAQLRALVLELRAGLMPLVNARRLLAARLLIAGLLTATTASPAAAQTEESLVSAVATSLILADAPPPVICMEVKTSDELAVRDPKAGELPAWRLESQVVGGSECTSHARGSRHVRTGEDALIVKVGIVEFRGETATVTRGWHRHGTNAGAYRCEATWAEGRWTIGPCDLLWIS